VIAEAEGGAADAAFAFAASRSANFFFRPGVCTLTPGVRGPAFIGLLKSSARSCGAGTSGLDMGDESNAAWRALKFGRERVAVPGVAAPAAAFCLRCVCGVAAMRYVLSSTRWSSGSLLRLEPEAVERWSVDGATAEEGMANGEDSGVMDISGKVAPVTPDLAGVSGLATIGVEVASGESSTPTPRMSRFNAS